MLNPDTPINIVDALAHVQNVPNFQVFKPEWSCAWYEDLQVLVYSLVPFELPCEIPNTFLILNGANLWILRASEVQCTISPRFIFDLLPTWVELHC